LLHFLAKDNFLISKHLHFLEMPISKDVKATMESLISAVAASETGADASSKYFHIFRKT
jgi:hypothetical protein